MAKRLERLLDARSTEGKVISTLLSVVLCFMVWDSTMVRAAFADDYDPEMSLLESEDGLDAADLSEAVSQADLTDRSAEEAAEEPAGEAGEEPAGEAGEEPADEPADEPEAIESSDEAAGEANGEALGEAGDAADPAAEAAADATADPAATPADQPADPAATSDQPAYPAQQFTGSANGVSVAVDAPQGAFPEGTTMHVAFVPTAQVIDAVTEALDSDVASVRAVDITFTNAEGEEIEPLAPISVSLRASVIARAEADDAKTIEIVHIDDATSAEPTAQVIEQTTEPTAANEVAFESDSFSIYVIAELVDAVIYSVVFQNGTSVVATENVKITKEQGAYQVEELYDPGVVAAEGQTFIGWAASANEEDRESIYTIDQLNARLAADVAENGDTYTAGQTATYHAVFWKSYNLRLLDEDELGNLTALRTYSRLQADSAEDRTITLDYTYTPQGGETFQGWFDPKTGTLYEEGRAITLEDNLDLYLKTTTRNWVVFDDNDGGITGGGASYTPPQLLIGEQAAERPADPTWRGYVFTGWNTASDGTGIWWSKTDDEAVNLFGQPISEDTILYAQWKPAEATYYVIFWKQNATDEADLPDNKKTYEYAGSDERTAKTGDKVKLTDADVNKANSKKKDYDVANYNEAYFKYNAAKSDTSEVTISPDGTTVLNVYYDRQAYTLTFQVTGNGYTYTPTTSTSNNNTQYGLVNGEYVQLTRRSTGGRGGSYYWTYGNDTRYNGTRYVRSSSTTSQTVKTITALYGHSIKDQFPIVGTNSVEYPTGTRWLPTVNRTVNGVVYFNTNNVVAYIDVMPPCDETLQLNTSSASKKTIVYWVEALNGTAKAGAETREYNGVLYEHYKTITPNYNFVTIEDNIEIPGFEKNGQDMYLHSDNRYYTSANGSMTADTVNFYYTRTRPAINFVSNANGRDSRNIQVPYEQPLASFAEGGTDAYTPDNGLEGYFFDGWYLDEAFENKYDFRGNTMPAEGLTLYAKWSTNRFRLVLVPTPEGAHNDEVQFANNQALTFRLDYNERVNDANISSTTAKRTGYVLEGWYTSPTFEPSTQWNFAEQVNKDTAGVDMDYQNSADWAAYGDNDGRHDNVRGILKLYAKWTLTVQENAVYVRYLVPEDYRTYDALGNLQTTIPVDTTAYLIKDDEAVQAVAVREAPTKLKDAFYFTTWELLNAEGAPSGTVASPGSTWQIDSNRASDTYYQNYLQHETVGAAEGATTVSYLTFQAVVNPVEGKSSTITYYGNGGARPSTGATSLVEGVALNTAFALADGTTFARPGYDLVAWNTAEDGSGTEFAPGNPVAADNLAGTAWTAGASEAARGTNTLYAQWGIHTYDISYANAGLLSADAAAGTTLLDGLGNPVSFKLDSTGVTLNNPTLNGYEFLGWSGPGLDGITTQAAISFADEALLHDRTYTANWAKLWTITFVDDNGTNLSTAQVRDGETPVFAGEVPSKAIDAQNEYEFAGWSPAIVPATADATYTATYTQAPRKYTVQFVDEDGTVLQSGLVAYGDTPAAPADNPVKASNVQYTYEFAGWTPAIEPVTGDATYTATYNQTVNGYTVTWKNYDGTLLETDANVAYGTTPSYDGAEPTKPATAQYTYTFAGWTPEVSEVTRDITYTATFDETVNTYTVTWANEDGTTLEIDQSVPYGTTPIYDGATPAKESTVSTTYTFAGWTPAVQPVTGDATYQATYSESARIYTVTYTDNVEGREVFADQVYEVAYGQPTPAFVGAEPTVEGYVFDGWSPVVAETVTGDATYKASWLPILNLTATITGHNATATYDGQPHEANGFDVAVTGAEERYTSPVAIELLDANKGKVSGTNVVQENGAVGRYFMGLTADDFKVTVPDKGYRVNVVVAEDGWLQIDPRDVAVTANPVEVTYTGQRAVVENGTYAVAGLLEGDTAPIEATVGLASEGDFVNAGTYENALVASGAELQGNYRVTYAPGALTVAKRQVTLTSGSDQQRYNGSALTNDTIEVSGEGFVAGQGAAYDVTGSQTVPGESENTFTYTLNEGTSADNYDITVEPGTLKVLNREAPYEITVEANSGEATYDGTAHEVTGLAETSFVIEDVTYTVSGLEATSGQQTNAGEYPVNMTGTAVVTDANGNDVTSQFAIERKPGTFTINRALATVTANDRGKVFGEDDPVLAATVTGLADGDDARVIDYNVSRETGENVGTYVITPSGEAIQGNYTVEYVPGTFTITKAAAPTIALEGYEGAYDGAEHVATYSGEFPEGTIVEFSTDNGDTWTAWTAENAPRITNAGTLNLQARAVNDNYETATAGATLTVKPLPATVAVNPDQTKVYGENDPASFATTVTGLLEGESEDLIHYSIARAEGENAGTYRIDLTAANNASTAAGEFTQRQGNYDVTFVPGTFTITKRPVTFTATSAAEPFTYDGQEHTVAGVTASTGTAIGLLSEHMAEVSATATGTNAGTYLVEITPASEVVISDAAGTNVTANYAITTEPGSFTIAKRRVTLDSATVSKPYDGRALTSQNVTVGGEGFASGDGATFAFSGTQTEVGTSANAFSYTLSTNTNADNYEITKTEGTLTVTNRDEDDRLGITVKAASATEPFIYNGAEQTFGGFETLSFLIGDGDDKATFTVGGLTASGAGTNVGEYANAIAGTPVVKDASGNDVTSQFTVTLEDGMFRIDPAASGALELQAVGYEGVYNGAAHEAGYTVAITEGTTVQYRTQTAAASEGVEAAWTDWTDIAPSRTDVGTTTFQVRATNPNYTTTEPVTASITVTRKPVTVKATDASKIYGEADPEEFGATVSGLVGEDRIAISVERVAGEDVGTYAITPSGEAEQGNYLVSYVPGTFTINQATGLSVALTDPIAGESIDSNAHTITAMYDGEMHGAMATVKLNDGALPEGTTVTIEYSHDGGETWSESVPARIDAGTSTIIARASNPNYGEAVSEPFQLIVNPRPISYHAAGTQTYTGGMLTMSLDAEGLTRESAAVQPTGGKFDLLEGHTLIVSGNASVSGINKGTYQYDGATDGTPVFQVVTTNSEGQLIDVTRNYSIAASGTLTIEPATATVTANSAQKAFGANDPALTFTIDKHGMGTEADVITVTGITRDAGEALGEYTITPLGDAEQGNFRVEFVPGTLTITQATNLDLYVVGKQNTVTYDGASHVVDGYDLFVRRTVNPSDEPGANAAGESESFTMVQLPESELVTLALNADVQARVSGTDAGTYNMGLSESSFTASSPNYSRVTLHVEDGELTINPATVTVTANDATKVYGDEEPAYTATITGLVNGEPESRISYTFSRMGNEDVNEGAGYAVTPQGDERQGNYRVQYRSGTLRITPAAAIVTADSVSKTYGFDDPAFTATVSGLKNNDTASVLTFSVARDERLGNDGQNVGTYTLISSGDERQGNYTVEYRPGTLTIEPRAITLTSSSASKVYDGLALYNHNVAISAPGFVQGEGVRIDVTGQQTEVGTSTNAFSYTFNEGTNPGNYSITGTRGILEVRSASIGATDPATPDAPGALNSRFSITGLRDYVYDATEHRPDVRVFDTATNKDVTSLFDVSYVNNVNASTANAPAYVVLTAKSDDTEKRYTGSAWVPFTIAKRPVTIKPDDITMTVGGRVPVFTLSVVLEEQIALESADGEAGLQTVSLADLAAGDIIGAGYVVNIGGVDDAQSLAAGTYTLDASNVSIVRESLLLAEDETDPTDNYEITLKPGTLTVVSAANAGGGGGGEPGDEPSTEPGNGPGTEPGNEPGNEPGGQPGGQPGNEPGGGNGGGEPGTEPGTQPGTQPGTTPGTEPTRTTTPDNEGVVTGGSSPATAPDGTPTTTFTPDVLTSVADPAPGGNNSSSTPTPIELIVDNSVPMATIPTREESPVFESIDDEDVPLANLPPIAECWIHYVMLAVMVGFILYYNFVIAHRNKSIAELRRVLRKPE